MNYYLAVALGILFFVTNSVWAYSPSVNNPSIPYEVFIVDENIEEQSEYLGELIGDPHTYEFSVDESTNLSLQLVQLEEDSLVPLSLIVIRVNEDNGGVAEVGRLLNSKISWQPYKDSVLGLRLVRSDVFEAVLSPGVYRVEVSTPDNIGRYMLVIGETEVTAGYFKTISQAYTIQSALGSNILGMFKSSYVHYPLGIVILLGLFYVKWGRRSKVKELNVTY